MYNFAEEETSKSLLLNRVMIAELLLILPFEDLPQNLLKHLFSFYNANILFPL